MEEERYIWKAVLSNGQVIYEINSSGQQQLFQIVLDQEKSGQLDELFLYDRFIGDDAFGVNLRTGSFIVHGIPIFVQHDNASYRIIFYRVRYVDSSPDIQRVSRGIARYGIGWQFTSATGQNKKLILEFMPCQQTWHFTVE